MILKDYYIVRGCFIGPNAFKLRKGTKLMGGYKVESSDFISDGGSMPLALQAMRNTERFGQFYPAFFVHDYKCANRVPGMTFAQANDEFKRDLILLGLDEDEAEAWRRTVEECGTAHWDAMPREPEGVLHKAFRILCDYIWAKILRLWKPSKNRE